MSSVPAVAWLAGGRVHLRTPDGAVKTIESEFGETVVERALSIERRHAWKQQGRGAQFRGLLWAGAGAEGAHPGLAITSLTRGSRPGELLYTLETREIAGVFAHGPEGGERRLFHGNERRVHHLACGPGLPGIACSIRRHGTSGLAMMDLHGHDLTELTEGDTIDEAPSFVPGNPRQIVFQSAGLGRSREGHVLGIGPYAVRRIDLDRGDIETLAEDPSQDFLGPRLAADGSLLYVRRPWVGARGASFWAATRDFVLFPVRLLYAIFQYLNFFTARYAGKPLTTAGGPKQEADARRMMVWGNLVEATASEQADDDTPGVVPASWVLERRRADGRTETVARGVLSFDVAPDGSLVYTNGRGVYHVDAAGRRERLYAGAGIEQVVAAG